MNGNFIQRIPKDSHANKLQQVLVEPWPAPIAIAFRSFFVHGKTLIKNKHGAVEARQFYDVVRIC